MSRTKGGRIWRNGKGSGGRASFQRDGKGSGSKGSGVGRGRQLCWKGKECTRRECVFYHPDGRVGPHGRDARRGRSRSGSRASSSVEKRSRTPSKSASKSPSGSKSASRSASRSSSPEAPQVDASDAFTSFAKKFPGATFDVFSPLSAIRGFDWRTRTAQTCAEMFVDDVLNRRYSGLCLRSPPSGPALTGPATMCTVSGHLQPPHYPLDSDVGAILFRKIPASVSTWTLFGELSRQRGFTSASCTKPEGEKMTREMRVRYQSAEEARAALSTVALVDALKPCLRRVSLLTPSPMLSAKVVPPEMSNPHRILKDLVLSARVIVKLDGLMGIPMSITEAILTDVADDEQKLDLQLLYLRRVHFFCFYSGLWCADEFELRNLCGCAIVRYGLQNGVPAPQEGEFAAAHEARLEEFLMTATCPMPLRPNYEDPDFKTFVAALITSMTNQLDRDQAECKQCTKKFKGGHYVAKHLLKVHAPLFESEFTEVSTKLTRAAFAADFVLRERRVQVLQ